jgi:hypothetical protein
MASLTMDNNPMAGQTAQRSPGRKSRRFAPDSPLLASPIFEARQTWISESLASWSAPTLGR